MIESSKLNSILKLKSLAGKVVLLRVDFNVAMSGKKILETERITRAYQTIDYLLKKKARVVLISHLGRPDGTPDKQFTLEPVAKFLKKKYKSLKFVPDCIGEIVKKEIKSLKSGNLILLENVRFYPGEEANSIAFASLIAAHANYYVNDAFAVCHRAHASVQAITRLLPSYAGLNLISEVENIDRVIGKFVHPGVAIIGGAKITGKINVIKKFLKTFEHVLIGGALANNFLAALNYDIGSSMVEQKGVMLARQLLKQFYGRIVIPVDVIVLNKSTNASRLVSIRELKSLSSQDQIVDIGPVTISLFKSYILLAQTLVWNGPLGKFETKPFDHGTNEVAKYFAERSAKEPFGIIGGGETIAAVNKTHLAKKVDFVSTGGGAMLEYIEKGTLPGLKVLIK